MKLGRKTNICTICKEKGETDWYNITSNNHEQRNNQNKLFSDRNNMIELCNSCHSKVTNQNLSTKEGRINQGIIPDKQKSRAAKAVAKQKSRDGRVLAQKRNLERKDKQERITSRKRSL